MSLDGFVAGPHHEMGWMTGTNRPGPIDEYVTTTGAAADGRSFCAQRMFLIRIAPRDEGALILLKHACRAPPLRGLNFQASRAFWTHAEPTAGSGRKGGPVAGRVITLVHHLGMNEYSLNEGAILL